jgi:DNA-binding response OmpR family regulator
LSFTTDNGPALDSDTRRLARGVDSPSHTVLVVDDDASIRFVCRVNLELAGLEVREAATLREAREALMAGRTDVVLLDVHVGPASGVAFLRELRRDHPGLPVALLTGSVGTSAPGQADADAVLAKPFELGELVETVRALASRTARTTG